MDYFIILAFIIGLLIRYTYKNHDIIKKYINIYLIYFGMPLIVFSSLLKSKTLAIEILLGVAFIYLIAANLLYYFIIKSFSMDAKRKASLFLSSTYGNVGYIGIPFGFMLFGDIGAAAAALLSVAGGFLHFSLGIVLATSYTRKTIASLKNLFNPIFLGVLAGFLLSRFDITLPGYVYSFALSAAYLLLFVIGLSIRIEKMDKTYTIAFLLRFLGSPLIMALALLITGFLEPKYYAFIFIAMMPPAFSSIILAVNYKLDSKFISNFTSVATIAFVIVATIIGFFV